MSQISVMPHRSKTTEVSRFKASRLYCPCCHSPHTIGYVEWTFVSLDEYPSVLIHERCLGLLIDSLQAGRTPDDLADAAEWLKKKVLKCS